IQGYGAAYDLAVDQMGIEALTGWLVEGLHRPGTKGDEHDMPDLDGVEEGQGRQYEDEAGGEALSGHNQAALVKFIRHNPAKKGKTHGGHAIGESHIAQGQGRTRELVDQPELAEA